MILFKKRDVDQYTNSSAQYLPGGDLFVSKSIQNKNFRQLLKGMAGELFSANGLLREYDILPDKTENFIAEWESAVGIPDSCFTGTGTIDERRRDINVKLAALGVQTEEDFVALAGLFDIEIKITHLEEASGIFPLVFDGISGGFLFFPTAQAARFTIFIDVTTAFENQFPLTFFDNVFPGFPFGTSEIDFIQCIFEKLKPANCKLIFRQV